MPGAAVIEARGLRKKFGGVLALDDLTLHLPEGSIFGYLGPNGAGKTTTGRGLVTHELPMSGIPRTFPRMGVPARQASWALTPEPFERTLPRWAISSICQAHGVDGLQIRGGGP